MYRHKKAAFLLLILSIALGCVESVASKEQSIHALRGAYLYYFSHFIEWPQGTQFGSGQFELCAFTQDAKDHYQLGTLNEKKLGDLSLRIQIYHSVDLLDQNAVSHCHMLYVSAKAHTDFTQQGFSLSKNTLLVTEGDEAGNGLIHLYVDKQKLKFYIYYEALKARGFKASSKLLRLSRERGDHG